MEKDSSNKDEIKLLLEEVIDYLKDLLIQIDSDEVPVTTYQLIKVVNMLKKIQKKK